MFLRLDEENTVIKPHNCFYASCSCGFVIQKTYLAIFQCLDHSDVLATLGFPECCSSVILGWKQLARTCTSNFIAAHKPDVQKRLCSHRTLSLKTFYTVGGRCKMLPAS